MSRPFHKRLGYDLARVFLRTVGVIGFGLRVFGQQRAPTTGGALICANHQSYFDPALVGLAFNTRLNYLARKTLFDIPGFKQLILFLDAIPLDREGPGLAGIRETVQRLKRGEQVLIFPEGTRTTDGEVAPLKAGFLLVARRGKVPLVPVGIDGCFQAWPRWQRWPGWARLVVVIGEPISAEQVARLDDDALLSELESRIRACHQQARAHRRRCAALQPADSASSPRHVEKTPHSQPAVAGLPRATG